MSAKKRLRPRVLADPGTHRTWGELVRKPKPQQPAARTGEFYLRTYTLPTVTVEPSPDWRGGRDPARANLQFTNALTAAFGESRTRKHRAAHPVREQQRLARLAAKVSA